jgi:hypothetical protein
LESNAAECQAWLGDRLTAAIRLRIRFARRVQRDSEKYARDPGVRSSVDLDVLLDECATQDF